MSERKVNLRVSAVGGDKFKAELRSIGKEGQHALSLIEGNSGGATRGLHATGLAADQLMSRLTALSVKAAQAANSFGTVATSGMSTLDRINRATGVTGGMSRSAEDIAAYGRAMDEVRAKYNPMFAAISKYRAELAQVKAAHASGAISADEMTAAIGRLRRASLADIDVIKGRAKGYEQMTKQGGLARFQMVQLGYQLNDVGVSLASGQNPFIVMIQQGAQIAQIYGGQGGVRAMLSQTLGIFTNLPGPVKAVGVAIGLGALAIKGMQDEINKTSKVTVTFGDTALAVWQVISEGIYSEIKPAVEMISGWFDAAWDLVVSGVTWMGNVVIKKVQAMVLAFTSLPNIVAGEFSRIFDIGVAAYEGIKATWSMLPSAIGDFAYSAANTMIDGVESMLNAVVDRINSFIEMLNSALSLLPEWATGEGSISIGTLGKIDLGNIDNPYEGAASNLTSSKAFKDSISALGNAATEPNDAWDEYVAGIRNIQNSDPMGGFFDAVSGRAQKNARDRLAKDKDKNKGSGAKEETDEVDNLIQSLQQELTVLRETDPVKKALLGYSREMAVATEDEKQKIIALVTALEDAKNGFGSISIKLREYSESARNVGGQIGDALVGAFESAEDAVADFVENGKLSVSDLATSIIADFARIGARAFITAPLSNALAGAFSGTFGSAITSAFVQHTGGSAGSGAMRQVSAANFLNAPRLHSGTGPVGLRSDEYAAILQSGERVLNRQETRDYQSGGSQPLVVNFNGVRDAKSFRQSRTQIASDLSRAAAMGRRGI